MNEIDLLFSFLEIFLGGFNIKVILAFTWDDVSSSLFLELTEFSLKSQMVNTFGFVEPTWPLLYVFSSF